MFLLTVILHWTSRVERYLFWFCFHLLSRTYLELCCSNLFMFKCHLSGLGKEALMVGVHIGRKLHNPQWKWFFALSAEQSTPQKHSNICKLKSLFNFSYGWFEELTAAAAGIYQPCLQVWFCVILKLSCMQWSFVIFCKRLTLSFALRMQEKFCSDDSFTKVLFLQA